MQILRLTARVLAAFAFLGLSGIASGAPQEGKDYVVLNPAQPTETGKNIEVLEVFSYACPHCAALEPKIEPWIKSLPRDVAFRRMPVVFRESWAPLAKTYYALESLGEIGRLNDKVFRAIHEDNIILTNQEVLFDWMEKQGVDRKKFVDVYNSFAVQSKVQRAVQKTKDYGVTGVPTLIVNGKFVTSPSMAGSHEAMFPVLDELIKNARTAQTAGN